MQSSHEIGMDDEASTVINDAYRIGIRSMLTPAHYDRAQKPASGVQALYVDTCAL